MTPFNTSGQLTIHDLLRAQHVERWTIINKHGRQSIAEHSYMVAVIALHLNHRLNTTPAIDVYPLVMFALFHDSPETRYGDIPTPGKDMIRRLSTPTIFKDMDEQLLPSVPFIDETPSLEVARIVEIADLLEAAAWIRENGVGEHARVVAGKMHHRLVGRVEDACKETGQDWYGPVNEVLMALGAPIIHHNSWIHKL